MRKPANEGRRRLKIFLSLLGGGTCAIAMALFVAVYGTPYNPSWWIVMAAILGAAFVAPRFLADPIEWIIAGYSNGAASAADTE